MIDEFATNRELSGLFKACALTQRELLARFNRGQVRQLALRTLKTYLASETAKSRVRCPEAVLERFRKIVHSHDADETRRRRIS